MNPTGEPNEMNQMYPTNKLNKANKMFALVLCAVVAACAGKKASTTPSSKDKLPAETLEHTDDATGGATYGGHTVATPRAAH